MRTKISLEASEGRRRDKGPPAAEPLGEAVRIADQMRGEFEFGAIQVAASRANECLRDGDTGGFDGWNRVCALLQHVELSPDANLRLTATRQSLSR